MKWLHLIAGMVLLTATVCWAAPTVTAVQPTDGSTASVSTTVTATFSESMNPATITAGSFTVSRFSGFKAVAAGVSHTVAVKNDGTVVSWGNGYSVPEGIKGVTSIAAGPYHTVALKDNGTVVAWGKNDYGQCTVPEGLTGVTAVAAGMFHTVALKSNGTVVTWGDNWYGQGTVPEGLTSVIAIAAGQYHTVALKSDGTVVAWGSNDFYQCNVPVNLTGVTAIAAGYHHTVALKDGGTVVGWGFIGSEYDLIPYTVPAGLSGVTAIATGYGHTIALKVDGTVVAWGDNTSGECAVPLNLNGVTALAAGQSHNIALKGNGTVVTWGNNWDGFSPSLSDYETTVNGAMAYDDAFKTASFTPLAPLQSNTTYYGTINTGAKNAAGVPLAADVRWSFTTKSAAAVTLAGLSQTYDGSPKAATAATTPTGLPVVITYDGSPIAPTSAGTYAVVATINDPNYEGSNSGTLTIAKANQSIGFTLSASSGLPVNFSVSSGPGIIIGNTLYFVGDGTVVVTVSQPGDGNYNAANIQSTISVTRY